MIEDIYLIEMSQGDTDTIQMRSWKLWVVNSDFSIKKPYLKGQSCLKTENNSLVRVRISVTRDAQAVWMFQRKIGSAQRVDPLTSLLLISDAHIIEF